MRVFYFNYTETNNEIGQKVLFLPIKFVFFRAHYQLSNIK